MHLLDTILLFIKEDNFIDKKDFLDLVVRFGFNFICTFIIVRLIYFPIYKNKDYLFTYFLFNSIIFMILYGVSGPFLTLLS